MKRLLTRFPIFELIPPFEFVQTVNEQSIHSYLDIRKETLKRWVIVGGYLGNEVPTILRNYPNCEITIFECSRRYASKLKNRFESNPRVKIFEQAVSDYSGTVEFFETNLKGSGSLLGVGELAGSIYGMSQAETFSVEAVTLDNVFLGLDIDVLQIDVQGAELKVLHGASDALTRTKAIFTEVSVRPDLYEGSVVFNELDAKLKGNGFHLALMGTDFNLTGNALYLKLDI